MDEKLELKIYKNYRAVMKKRNKVGGGYPSYWKQYGRKVTVERYNVSYQEVKRIVAKYDEIYGITHEKSISHYNQPNNLPSQSIGHLIPYQNRPSMK